MIVYMCLINTMMYRRHERHHMGDTGTIQIDIIITYILLNAGRYGDFSGMTKAKEDGKNVSLATANSQSS